MTIDPLYKITQLHLRDALMKAVETDRVGTAYLFSGPKGIGKQTAAWAFGEALERPISTQHAEKRPGVDELIKLIAKSCYKPKLGHVLIVSEVQRLQPPAEQLLLGRLENPAKDVVWILTTSDAQSVLPVIRSRTQHFDLGYVPQHTCPDCGFTIETVDAMPVPCGHKTGRIRRRWLELVERSNGFHR